MNFQNGGFFGKKNQIPTDRRHLFFKPRVKRSALRGRGRRGGRGSDEWSEGGTERERERKRKREEEEEEGGWGIDY